MYQYTIFDVLKDWAESEVSAMDFLIQSLVQAFSSSIKSHDFCAYTASNLILVSLRKSKSYFCSVFGVDYEYI